jgi:hypothetical protein
MQPQSEAEGLEASWSVTGVSPHWKIEEADVWGPQMRAAAVDTLTQEEWSLHTLAGFLLFQLLFHQDPPGYWMVLAIFRTDLPSSVTAAYVDSFWKHPHKHTQKCALLIS